MQVTVEISGSIPHFSRKEISLFAREVLWLIGKIGRLGHRISEISLAFVDDETMQRLNRQFRN